MTELQDMSTPDPGSPAAPSPASTPQRDAVLRAAARLFAQQGYERTTVRELGEAVGLRSASLFHYFATKADILAAVMEHGLVLAANNATLAIERGSTPRERLEYCFRYYVIGLLSPEYRDFMTVLLYDFRSLPPGLAKRVQRVRDGVEQRWQTVLDEAVPDGDRAKLRLTGQFIFGAMCWALQWYNPRGALSLDELSRRFADLAFATCGLEVPERSRMAPALGCASPASSACDAMDKLTTPLAAPGRAS